MFSKTAQYYDLIYSWKDYPKEVSILRDIIELEKRSDGMRLLDVACGTGLHMQHLGESYEVEGLDLDEGLLELARQRLPEVSFHHGDMIDFDLGERFDVVLCLFSSIGYVKTKDKLQQAIACMAKHLIPGGVLLVEPWFTPEVIQPNTPHAKFIDEPDLKLARVNTTFVEDGITLFDMHYLVGTPEGTEHFIERHELGLFTIDEMKEAFRLAGLDVHYDDEGLMGRGLYVGRR